MVKHTPEFKHGDDKHGEVGNVVFVSTSGLLGFVLATFHSK